MQLAVLIGKSGKRDWTPRYITEILAHAGLPFTVLNAEELVQSIDRYRLLVLAGEPELNEEQGQRIAGWVRAGNGLLTTGGLCSSGGRAALEEICGTTTGERVAEAWIQIDVADHPVTRNLLSSLHIFDGVKLQPRTANILASLTLRDGTNGGTAIVEQVAGNGRSLVFGPNLPHSVLHIQQGIPIHEDGIPAPDGSAPVNDGIWKTDDGIVLDWERDRTQTEKSIFFQYPIADELRELLIRGILHLANRLNIRLPLIWYWPRNLKAVAMMSHDSDHNDPDLGEDLLKLTQELSINTCWCIIYPGGYRPDFYARVKEYGSEIALHYDSRTGGPRTTWSEANMTMQHHWLEDMSETKLISNKNHFLRWEGYLELFRWEERLGIQLDQNKGPSKRGNVGFLYGGSHPWFPFAPAPDDRYLDVLEVNLHSQDLILTCDYEVGPLTADQVVRVYGVYHPLFHPAHVRKPGIADGIRAITNYVRDLGMEWWNSMRINAWERQRRGITWDEQGTISLPEASPLVPSGDVPILYVLAPEDRPSPALELDGKPLSVQTTERYGFSFVTAPLEQSGKLAVH